MSFDLNTMPLTPTKNDLEMFIDTPLHKLPKAYKRADHERFETMPNYTSDVAPSKVVQWKFLSVTLSNVRR